MSADTNLERRRKAEAENWVRIRRLILLGWENGLTAKQIAPTIPNRAGFGNGRTISVSTVRNYGTRLQSELAAANQTQALAKAYRRGYLPCPCGVDESELLDEGEDGR